MAVDEFAHKRLERSKKLVFRMFLQASLMKPKVCLEVSWPC